MLWLFVASAAVTLQDSYFGQHARTLFKGEAEVPENPAVPQDSPPIIYRRRFPVSIVIGGVGISCLCIMALTLIACKIRYNRFNRIHVMEIDSQLQAIARAVTYITVPITGIQPNKLTLPPPHKKNI